MLEGRRYKTAEIVQALRNRDDEVDRYLHPLMQEIRRYADAICFAWEKSNEGCCQVNIDNLKRLHRLITPDPRDRGGLYRETSPVHRDYFQSICEPDRIPYNLKRLMDSISAECDGATNPIQFAAHVHHTLMHIYPFRRNPGTVLRLFTNMLLLSRGYPPAIIPAHRRDAYYKAINHPESHNLAEIYTNALAVLMERVSTPLELIEGTATA